MRKRCNNKNATNYSDYGGRGITICTEWNSFLNFKEWALSHGYSDEMSIDRIDVNGNYEPNNCRWVDSVAQANNRRASKYYTVNGVTHTLAEWARQYNLSYKLLWKKVHNGVPLKELIGA